MLRSAWLCCCWCTPHRARSGNTTLNHVNLLFSVVCVFGRQDIIDDEYERRHLHVLSGCIVLKMMKAKRSKTEMIFVGNAYLFLIFIIYCTVGMYAGILR